MDTEIEVKFLRTDHAVVRRALTAVGAVCEQPMRLMRRSVFATTPEMHSESGYIRVRDEGERVTLTYKQFDKELTLHGAQEIETTVADYDKTVAILKAAGIRCFSTQESKRETWKYRGTEVVLDEWPWLEPYIEIEGESESALREVASELGFDWEKDAVFGDVMAAYRAQYPHLSMNDTVGSLSMVRFGDALPEMFEHRKGLTE